MYFHVSNGNKQTKKEILLDLKDDEIMEDGVFGLKWPSRIRAKIRWCGDEHGRNFKGWGLGKKELKGAWVECGQGENLPKVISGKKTDKAMPEFQTEN